MKLHLWNRKNEGKRFLNEIYLSVIEDGDAYQEEIRRQLQNEDTPHTNIEEINYMITEAISRATQKATAKQKQKKETLTDKIKEMLRGRRNICELFWIKLASRGTIIYKD